MLLQNSELRAQALESLKDKWGNAVVISLVYLVISIGASAIPFIGGFSMLIISPIVWGVMISFLGRFRGEEIEIGQLFDGFNDYVRIAGTFLLMYLYIFLWTLLLIIPGLIKQYSYAMTPYILKDEPELTFNGVIEKSMDMMDGNKMKLFLLDLSFIGWAFLSILTLGIGLLWLYPYMFSARAAFYEDLKKEVCSLDQA